jgi:DNA polymerase-4
MPLRYLLVDLNSYFASVEQQLNPLWRGRPLAVLPSMTDRTSCIATSIEAKRFGVKTGTPVPEARRLCPEIVFTVGSHDVYTEFHQKIVEAVESCLPVTQVLSVDEMTCALKGPDQLEVNARKLAMEIKHTIRTRVGEVLQCSIGIGPNIMLAKIASDMQKPDGLVIIRQEELPQNLFHLKLRDFPGIGSRMEKRLHRKAVYTVETLGNLSVAEMIRIWGGINGERYWHWLRGEDIAFPRTQKPKSVGHSHVLAPQLRTRELALRVAQKLLLKAAKRMREQGLWAKRLNVSVRLLSSKNDSLDEQAYWESGTKIQETQSDKELLDALKRNWASYPVTRNPIKVSVTLCDLVSEDHHHYSLWERPELTELSHAMDRIHSKFGKSSLYWGALHELSGVAPTRIAFLRIPDKKEFEPSDFEE